MRTRPFAASLSVFGSAVALLAVTGCGSSSDSADAGKTGGASGAPAVASVPKLVSVTDKSLPIEAYMLSDEQLNQMSNAVLTLRERCMSRFGIAYKVQRAHAGYTPESRTQLRYGVTDTAEATSHGYKPAGSEKGVVKVKPPELTQAANVVLTGSSDPKVKPGSAEAKGGQDYNGQKVPVGGCIGEATAKLHFGQAEAAIASKINTESWDKSYEDARVKAVFAKWSSCMKAKGYTYADPMKATNDNQWQTTVASPREKLVAAADTTCKARYNVVGTWYTVEVAYQDQMVEQNAQALAEAKKTKDKQLKLMAEVS